MRYYKTVFSPGASMSTENTAGKVDEVKDAKKVVRRRSRCGKCRMCKTKPCGDCIHCKQRAEGKSLKPCIFRQCPNLEFRTPKAKSSCKRPSLDLPANDLDNAVKRGRLTESGDDCPHVTSFTSRSGHPVMSTMLGNHDPLLSLEHEVVPEPNHKSALLRDVDDVAAPGVVAVAETAQASRGIEGEVDIDVEGGLGYEMTLLLEDSREENVGDWGDRVEVGGQGENERPIEIFSSESEDIENDVEIEEPEAPATNHVPAAPQYQPTPSNSFSVEAVETKKVVRCKQLLGKGSYGVVYSAVWQCGKSSIACAAKFPTYCSTQNLPHSSRIMRETDLILSTVHPNIVQHFAVQLASNSLPIFLMELMDSNLTRYLITATTTLSLHVQVDLCRDIAFGLTYLHSLGIVHGNLTGSNVLLRGRTAKISDFTIGRLVTTQTLAQGSHLPPEVREGGLHLTDKADIYSYGLLVILIITRGHPFSGDRQSTSVTPSSTTLTMADGGNLSCRFSALKADSSLSSLLSAFPWGHLLENLLHSCVGTSTLRPSANALTKRLLKLTHRAEYLESKQSSEKNAQRDETDSLLEVETLRQRTESVESEVASLRENFVAESQRASEQLKLLQAALDKKEAQLEAYKSRSKDVENCGNLASRVDKRLAHNCHKCGGDSVKCASGNQGEIDQLRKENSQQKIEIQDLKGTVQTLELNCEENRTELQSLKRGLKAKLVSFIEQL